MYVDACGSTSFPFAQPFRSTTDNVKPTAPAQPTILATTCNQQPAFVDPTVTDNCTGAAPTLKSGYPQTSTVTATNCTSTQTKTWVYVDACGNESDPFVQTATWTTDNVKPTVTGQPTITGTTCSQQPAFVGPTVTDNCTGAAP